MIKDTIRFLVCLCAGIVMCGLLAASGSAADDLDRGMALYQANCFQCHGEKGDGKGPEAGNFSPGPTDFTSAGMASVPDSAIEKAVVDGVAGVESHSWGGILSSEEVEALIRFIRTFQQ